MLLPRGASCLPSGNKHRGNGPWGARASVVRPRPLFTPSRLVDQGEPSGPLLCSLWASRPLFTPSRLVDRPADAWGQPSGPLLTGPRASRCWFCLCNITQLDDQALYCSYQPRAGMFKLLVIIHNLSTRTLSSPSLPSLSGKLRYQRVQKPESTKSRPNPNFG